jgi:hypothetical protein
VALRLRAIGGSPSGWVGVSTYDGARWVTYDATMLPSLVVTGLAADSSGSVWVGTDAGLARFDGVGWTVFRVADGLPSDHVQDVATGQDGTVWVATDAGLASYRQGTWAVFRQPGYSQLLFVDPWGQLWMQSYDAVTYAGALSRFDGANWAAVDLGGDVRSMASGGGPLLWAVVGSSPPILKRYDGVKWSDEPVTSLTQHVIGTYVAADPNSAKLYLGMFLTAGLHEFDGQTWSAVRISDGPGALLTMAVMVDAADRVLVSLFNGGRSHGFSRYAGGPWETQWSDPRADGIVLGNAIATDSNGAVWVSGWRHGVARYAANRWEKFDATNGLPDDGVWALAADANGGMWVGTDVSGVAHYDGHSWRRYRVADGLASNSIRAALVDQTGDVWFGTLDAGVSRFDGRRWLNYSKAYGLGGSDVHGLTQGRDGTLWAAGHNWLARFDGARWHSIPAPAPSVDSGSYVGVAVGLDGAVWYANQAENYGVARYDGLHWTTYGVPDGLLSNTVFDLAVDSQGTVWAATSLGVSAFTPQAIPVPTPTPIVPAGPCICRLARQALPSAVLNDAIANPARHEGWQQPLDPGKPVSPYNPPRTCLTLRNPNVAFHPTFNGPVWRVGCP